MYDTQVRIINKALNTNYTADDMKLDIVNNKLIEVSSGKELELSPEVLAEIAREKRKEHLRIMQNYS
jgi:hypothetical protein